MEWIFCFLSLFIYLLNSTEVLIIKLSYELRNVRMLDQNQTKTKHVFFNIIEKKSENHRNEKLREQITLMEIVIYF